jgi:hypothetical protein
MLQHQKDRARHDIVTLDEFWFYFTTDHEQIWLPQGTEATEREQMTVQSRKMQVTIVWNPTELYRIAALHQGMKFNADYYISHILDPLAGWRRSQIGDSDRRAYIHPDSAPPHTAKKVTEFLARNGMKRAPHLSYSRDLAPCEFSLCRRIKGTLASAPVEEPDQLLRAIDVIFSPLKKSHWSACFRSE